MTHHPVHRCQVEQEEDDKWWLTFDETKDKSTASFKYDKASATWVPDTKSS
jgi:hypothetical protein